MDLNKREWLGIISSLMSAKNNGWITDDEYFLFKDKLKEWFDNKDVCEGKYTDYSSYDNAISKDDLIDLIDSLFELEDKMIEKEIGKLSRTDLYHLLDLYNWDDGFSIPEKILNHSDCDMALAMEVFDLADGYWFIEKCFINKEQPKIYEAEWRTFCAKLFKDLGAGKFKIDDTPTELSVGFQVALLKQGVDNNLTKKYKFLFENL